MIPSHVIIAASTAGLIALHGVEQASAQVALDGSANPAFRGALPGPDFDIRAEFGRRAGRNLFHSFERFSLATGERATFSGPDAIRNVISRVTGGKRSDIDGTIRSTIPGADLFFLNPAGVAFGPNARLDLKGSFHVSTADELRFTDGTKFSATNLAASSFTVAAPEAFGFLGPAPAPILVDQSALAVPASESFSIVGGDIDIIGGGGLIAAEAGKITLAAVGGPGEARLGSGAIDAVRKADISLTHLALIDTSGDGGGTIRIRGGQSVVDKDSRVFAGNLGPTDGTVGIDVQAETVSVLGDSRLAADVLGSGSGGDVSITARDVKIEGGFIGSDTFAEGDAGNVNVSAGRLEIHIGEISSATFADGDAGSINLRAHGDLDIRNRSRISSSTSAEGAGGNVNIAASGSLEIRNRSDIRSDTSGSTGKAGTVTLHAANIEIRDRSFVSSSSSDAGDAGDVHVTAEGKLDVSDSGVSTNAAGFFGGEVSVGKAGAVTLQATDIAIRTGFIVSSGQGNAGGNVSVTAVGKLTLDAEGIIQSSTLGEVDAADPNVVRGGTVNVRAAVISMREGSQINSDGRGAGVAGDIVIEVLDRLQIDDSEITTESMNRGGGRIIVRVGELIDLRQSKVSTTVTSNASATAGDILIDPKFLVLDQSRITANAEGGTGGNIRIVADNLAISPDSVIEATGERSGSVNVVAREENVTQGLVLLDTALLDVTSQLPERCGARRDVGASSFTGVGRAALPPTPDGPLASVYAVDEVAVREALAKTGSNPTEGMAAASKIRLADLTLPCAFLH